MLRIVFLVAIILGAIFGIACQPALAQSNRTFVSGLGSDANNCAIATPCRTFAFAITKTNSGGEIAVLDTAGYGEVTIAKAISIIAPDGIEAGITVPSGDTGVFIAAGAGDIVTLRGLTITGGGVGGSGVVFSSGNTLIIKNCVVRGFAFDGINVSAASTSTTVSDTVVSSNMGAGINLTPNGTAASLSFKRVDLIGNMTGFAMNTGNTTALVKAAGVESVATGNNIGFSVSNPNSSPALATLLLDNVKVINNATGVDANNGTIILSRSTINGNTTDGFATFGLGVVQTYGDNRIYDTTNRGGLTPTGVQ
jgi:hypothetical protein